MHEAKSPLRLGVNVDHVATLREARGTLYPDPLEAAKQCVQAGAEGITIHLREDRRHIQDDDVYRLHEALDVPLNLEMAHAPDIVRIALDVKPDEVCLVPERREELTTEGGLDVFRLKPVLRPVIHQLRETGILISLFIEPNDKQLEAAAELEVPYVELHTGTYCDSDNTHVDKELQRLIQGACMAHDLTWTISTKFFPFLASTH